MTKRKRWTVEEDRVLADQVTRNSHNLVQAFQKAGEILERTPNACKEHWYIKLSKDHANVCFATISSTSKSINRKNTQEAGQSVSKSWWKKFLDFLCK